MLFRNNFVKPTCTKSFQLKLPPNQPKISERSPKSLRFLHNEKTKCLNKVHPKFAYFKIFTCPFSLNIF